MIVHRLLLKSSFWLDNKAVKLKTLPQVFLLEEMLGRAPEQVDLEDNFLRFLWDMASVIEPI